MSLRIEDAQGPVNGTNKVFWTSLPYLPGTVEVFRNGMLQKNDLTDGWTELGGIYFELNEAPITTDLIRVAYRI